MNKDKNIIFSIESDSSTDAVMNWLALKSEVLRINKEKLNHFPLEVELTNKKITVRCHNIEIDRCSLWFRKPTINYEAVENISLHDSFNVSLHSELTSTAKVLQETVMKNNKYLGSNYDIEKIQQLSYAQEVGLMIPNTIISNNKKVIDDFIKEHKNGVITKPIRGIDMIRLNNYQYKVYTEEVRQEDIQCLGDEFYPMLLQEKLEKNYEIRSFYLDGSFYSMAIFSQLDTQTKIDFRVYNHSSPNRTVPFQLDKKIELKLIKLMKKCKLNTGSIDIVKTLKGKYVFLEVNPHGQFGMVSYPCNYYLEEKIANFLNS